MPHQGMEPASAACWSDSLPTEPYPHSIVVVRDTVTTVEPYPRSMVVVRDTVTTVEPYPHSIVVVRDTVTTVEPYPHSIVVVRDTVTTVVAAAAATTVFIVTDCVAA